MEIHTGVGCVDSELDDGVGRGDSHRFASGPQNKSKFLIIVETLSPESERPSLISISGISISAAPAIS